MAINWNQAEFVSPKIQIAPDQLPLEAAMKVGEVLQGRYDQALTQDTKLSALNKKLMGSVDPADQELAKEITQLYGDRLKDRASKGDYHNMRWQTAADAEDYANIYTGLSEKAKLNQKYRDYINTTKDVADPNKRKWMLEKWQKAQTKSGFDAENRLVTGLNVDAPKIIGDTDYAKWADTFGNNYKADGAGGKKASTIMTKAGDKLPDGSTSAGGAYKNVTGGKWERVRDADVIKGLYDYAQSDPNLQATIDRDTEFSIDSNPLREGETLASRREQVESETFGQAARAAGNKYGFQITYSETESTYDTQMNNLLASASNGYSNQDMTNLIPSQKTVAINENYNNLNKQLSGITYNKNGSIDSYSPNLSNGNKVLDAAGNAITAIPLVGQALKLYNASKSSEEKMKEIIPLGLYDIFKKQGFTDRQMVTAYQQHIERTHKTVTTGYSFISSEDQSQSVGTVAAATADADYVSADGTVVKGSELKTGDLKFYPAAGTYAIVKDGVSYQPTTVIPGIEKTLSYSKEIYDDFTNIGSKANIVVHPFTGQVLSIMKDEIRPDGTYKGRVGLVQKVDGKWVKAAEPVTFDTQKEGLTPSVINRKIQGALKFATQSIGIQ